MPGERAEGFWWVLEGDAWAVVEVRSGRVRWPGLATDSWDADAPGIEWGPYLGKSPDDTDNEVLTRLDIDTRFT